MMGRVKFAEPYERCAVRKHLRRGRALLLPVMLVVAFPMTMVFAKDASQRKPYSRVFRDPVVTISVEVADTTLQIAEPTDIVIHVDAPAGSEIGFPEFGEAWKPLQLVSEQKLDSVPSGDDGDRRRWTRRAQVESLRSGSVTVPAIEISVTLPDGVGPSRKMQTEPIHFSIATSLPESVAITEFRDIKGTVDVPSPAERVGVRESMLVLLALIVFVLAIYAWRRFRRRSLMPIHAWALQETARIRRRGRDRVRSVSELQNDLMDVLRQYLTERFRLDAQAMSSHEIIHSLHAIAELPSSAVDKLLPLVESADRARFAGPNPQMADVSPIQCNCDLLEDFLSESNPGKSGSSQTLTPMRTRDV